jgi:transcriptional regulator with XRE-family HTH domain
MGVKLQDLLAEARRAKAVSLRTVERATGISNAYLSQMESGVVAQPSPKKLLALAEYYNVSYDLLMSSCGYVPPGSTGRRKGHDGMSFMGNRLTPEEGAAVAAFLYELRKRSKKE